MPTLCWILLLASLTLTVPAGPVAPQSTPRIPRKVVYPIRALIDNPPCPPGECCQ